MPCTWVGAMLVLPLPARACPRWQPGAAGGSPAGKNCPLRAGKTMPSLQTLGPGVGYTVTNSSSPGWGEPCTLKQPGRTQQEVL